MFLFKDYHKPMILARKKRATRRWWEKSRANAGSVHQAKTGYRKEDMFAKIQIKEVYKQRLGDMTDEDARLEGHDNVESYKKEIIELNGAWNPDDEPFVYEFDLWTEAMK